MAEPILTLTIDDEAFDRILVPPKWTGRTSRAAGGVVLTALRARVRAGIAADGQPFPKGQVPVRKIKDKAGEVVRTRLRRSEVRQLTMVETGAMLDDLSIWRSRASGFDIGSRHLRYGYRLNHEVWPFLGWTPAEEARLEEWVERWLDGQISDAVDDGGQDRLP